MVVLDTCALIELCKSEVSLSKSTFKKIDQGAYVLSISFAEIACKIKTGKLEINVTPKKLYTEISTIPALEIVDINTELWLAAIELGWDTNKDPADRIIIAFAKQLKLPIVTTDKRIKRYYKNVIW